MRLKDRVAIVTGGSKGIGYGIAAEFLKEGARVLICGRSAEDGARAVESLREHGSEVVFEQADVSQLDDLQHLVERCVAHFGQLDIYVANAGVNDPEETPFLEITPESFDRIMGVNLRGVFFGGQAAARRMVQQGHGGVIINISSVNAYLALDSQIVYTTSKGAIQQLTKVQAVALARHRIRVNAIAPGPIDTRLMRQVGSDSQLVKTILSRTPIGRIGTVTECGRLAVFLAHEDSEFIFGQSIYIDGGRGFQAFPTPGYRTVTDQEYEILQQALQSGVSK